MKQKKRVGLLLQCFLNVGTSVKLNKVQRSYQDSIYLIKVNNGKTITIYEICSKLTIQTPGVFIANLEQVNVHCIARCQILTFISILFQA